MHQKMIMQLLMEASREECQEERLDQIQRLLQRAALGRDSDDTEFEQCLGTQRAGIFGRLWEEMIEHRPDLLPIYFPVFVILCGPFEENINWNGLKGKIVILEP